MAGATEKRPGLLLAVTTNASVCPASSGGPLLMLVAQPVTLWAPASSLTAWSALSVTVGPLLTGLTVIVTVCVPLLSLPALALPSSSFSTMVMVALPLALAAGV